MSSAAVHYSTAAGVATITLAEPETKNVLSASLVAGLLGGLADATADPGVRVVVLANTGTTFCAGADLRNTSTGTQFELADILDAILKSDKPVVGAIGGHCVGGGVALAAACDLSVIADDATVSFAEVRLGLVAAITSVVCLPKLRPADAAELLLLGRRITAPEAVALGLFNRTAPRSEVADEVSMLLADLVLGGPEALAATKELLRELPQLTRDEAFQYTAELSRQRFASAEAAEGIAARRDRRRPVWLPHSNDESDQ
jgi:methylglutaconyl-CoA hydratase